MADQSTSNRARRRLLKAIAGGGGLAYSNAALPRNWSRPVIDSVVLPAHAQTTGVTDTTSGPDRPNRPGPVTCSGTPNCQQDVFPNPLVRMTWSGTELSFEVNPGSLDGSVGNTSIAGNGDFSGTGNAIFSCVGGSANGRLPLEIEGNLDVATGAVTGSFVMTILCDSAQICVVCGSFSGTLSENVEGEPTVSGVASECCPNSSQVIT